MKILLPELNSIHELIVSANIEIADGYPNDFFFEDSYNKRWLKKSSRKSAGGHSCFWNLALPKGARFTIVNLNISNRRSQIVGINMNPRSSEMNTILSIPRGKIQLSREAFACLDFMPYYFGKEIVFEDDET